jgi:glycosyltransferase involved in cell wall biosynthesis
MCLLEAMAARVPVVATRVGSVPNIVLPGVTGLLVDAGDEQALAAAIIRLLTDRLLAHGLAQQGRTHIERTFSSDAAAAAYAHLYDETLSRCRARTQRHRS